MIVSARGRLRLDRLRQAVRSLPVWRKEGIGERDVVADVALPATSNLRRHWPREPQTPPDTGSSNLRSSMDAGVFSRHVDEGNIA